MVSRRVANAGGGMILGQQLVPNVPVEAEPDKLGWIQYSTAYL